VEGELLRIDGELVLGALGDGAKVEGREEVEVREPRLGERRQVGEARAEVGVVAVAVLLSEALGGEGEVLAAQVVGDGRVGGAVWILCLFLFWLGEGERAIGGPATVAARARTETAARSDRT
jgi:hypothetical protein